MGQTENVEKAPKTSWFDGVKAEFKKIIWPEQKSVEFEYDWDRYYKIVRSLQPDANIAICGPDIRWVGNEAGKARKSEGCFSSMAISAWPSRMT